MYGIERLERPLVGTYPSILSHRAFYFLGAVENSNINLYSKQCFVPEIENLYKFSENCIRRVTKAKFQILII